MSSTMRRLRNGVLIVAAVVAVASSSVSTQVEPPIDPDLYWNDPNGSQNDQQWIHPFFDISDFSAENVSSLFVNETSSVPFIRSSQDSVTENRPLHCGTGNSTVRGQCQVAK